MADGDDEPIDGGAEETPLEQTVSGAVTGLTLLVAFGLMFAGVQWFWIAFVVGFAGLLPMALGAVRLYEREQDGLEAGSSDAGETDRDAEDALDALRERYARGELSEPEFERRVEKLLETESVEDARTFLDADGAAADADGATADADGAATDADGAAADADGAATDADRSARSSGRRNADGEPELDRETE